MKLAEVYKTANSPRPLRAAVAKKQGYQRVGMMIMCHGTLEDAVGAFL
jgi:hypothetical protein